MRRLVMEASIAEIGANWNKKDFFFDKKIFFSPYYYIFKVF